MFENRSNATESNHKDCIFLMYICSVALRKMFYSVVTYYAYINERIYVVYFYFWILFLQMSLFQIYIILQDNIPKTRSSERVASTFYSGSFRQATKKAVAVNVLKLKSHFLNPKLYNPRSEVDIVKFKFLISTALRMKKSLPNSCSTEFIVYYLKRRVRMSR